MANKHFSRRRFLKIVGATAAAGALMSPRDAILLAYAQDATIITFGGWGGIAEDEGVRAAIEVFEAEQLAAGTPIQVEWLHTPDAAEFGRVLLTDIAAGTAPDTSFILSDQYETLRQNGVLLDITEQIQNDPLLGQPDYFIQPQEANRSANDEGRWHGVGSTWVASHIYYNAEIFDDAGITPPEFAEDEIWDWDTFVENSKQLTLDANGLHPDDEGFDPENIQQWAVDWPFTWMHLAAAVHSNGGQFITEEGLIGLDSPEALEALQRVADLIYVHHVAPRSAALSSLGMTNTQMIDSGRLAMGVDGSWALSWMNPSLLSVPMGTGALPKIKQPATMMQAHFHAVLASTQNPEAAWQWIRFLSTPFYQTQFLKIGLWLPSQTALATEEGMATWITEGIHPDNYRQFVSEYLPEYGVAVRLPPGYIEANNDYLTPAFEALANGEAAETVIPDAVRQANQILEANR